MEHGLPLSQNSEVAGNGTLMVISEKILESGSILEIRMKMAGIENNLIILKINLIKLIENS